MVQKEVILIIGVRIRSFLLSLNTVIRKNVCVRELVLFIDDLICDKFIDQFLSYCWLWYVQLSPSVITDLILNWPDDPQFLDWTTSFIQTSVVHTPKGKRIATGKDFKGKSIFASHGFLISTAPHELLAYRDIKVGIFSWYMYGI